MFTGFEDLELVIVSVCNPVSKIALALFYRPPSSSYCIFDNLFSVLCNHVNLPLFSNFVLLGDFNVNFFDTSHPLFSKLQLVSSSLSLVQVVSEPTHFFHNSCSLIDLVFLSCPSSLISCITIPPLANSDHAGLSLTVSFKDNRKNPKRICRKVWRYDIADYELANSMISNVDWDALLSFNDIDTCWANWHSKYMQIMDACIPQTVLRCRKNLPWITKAIIQAIRRRNALLRDFKKSNDNQILNKYKKVRNRVVTMLRESKLVYFQNLGSCSQKEFWKAAKLLNKQDSSVPTLSDDSGTPVTSNFAKATLLNNFFYDCFNHALPPLQDELQRCNPDSCPEELLCTVEEIEELLLTLKTDKSTGPDNVSLRMLKSTAHSIAPSMTKLFNLSIASGSYPQARKLARIVP